MDVVRHGDPSAGPTGSRARIPLVYVLHSGGLYGTERMALATVEALADEFVPTILAPPGPLVAEARRIGVATVPFASRLDLIERIRPLVAAADRLAFIATGVVHSLVGAAWSVLYRRPIVHLHLVHGGAEERDSYGRKRRLNHAGVTFVAVSAFVRARLLAHGVHGERVAVIENFLPGERVAGAPRRAAFTRPGIRRVLVVSRVDPLKRVGLLLDALAHEPRLAGLEVRVLGTGWELDALRARAAASHPNVTFAGFCDDVPGELAAADALVHCCPVEPFGLAILEAMAAGVPVVVPDRGGAGSLVDPGVTGFHFRADDPGALASRLCELMEAPAALLNRIAAAGRGVLDTRFSAAARTADYRALLHRGLAQARW